MKIFRYLLIMSVVAFANPSFSQGIISNDEVFITITGETSREELSELRAQLLAVGMDFKYNPAFDGNRRLISISVEISADADHIGTAENLKLANPAEKLQFHMKKENGAITTWCVGTCPQ